MRVLLTTDTVGGVWTFTKELSGELLRRGHLVRLVSFGRLPSRDQLAWCGRMERRFTRFGLEASNIPLEWMAKNEDSYDKGHSLLMRIANTFAPDVVHSNQFCYGALPLDVPVVVTAHSDVMSWAATCRPNGLEESTWLVRYRSLVQRGLAGAHAVVAPTRWMLGALCENFEVLGKGKTILNGVGPLDAGNKQRNLQAVSAGRFWDEGKNLSLLTEVESTVPILVAGDCAYAGTASSTAINMVEVLGVLEEEALHSLFQETAIYIAPSRYEPFGLAALEAAQCGCTLLLNDIPSFREIWGDCALYFKNAHELERVLIRISKGEIDLTVARQMTLKRAREMTAGRMADAYIELYGSLMQQSAKHHPEVSANVR